MLYDTLIQYKEGTTDLEPGLAKHGNVLPID